MQERHINRQAYFDEQIITTEKYVIPYLAPFIKFTEATRVLEVGCGEGGNLVPFLERGCQCVGVDLNKSQIELARSFIDQKLDHYDLKLFSEDMFLIPEEEIGKFDLIFLRDVIEHIHDQEKFMSFIKSFLKPGGIMFFGFPPWTMPFGGHQQVCQNKLLSKTPYYHILPKSIYKKILQLGGVDPQGVDGLLEIKETGISTSRFEKIIASTGFEFLMKTKYLINPNYEIKFGLKPSELNTLLGHIPVINDLITTCYYCVVRQKK
jgi:SAM-dependent methyltransferase